jgi:hypothetical protein
MSGGATNALGPPPPAIIEHHHFHHAATEDHAFVGGKGAGETYKDLPVSTSDPRNFSTVVKSPMSPGPTVKDWVQYINEHFKDTMVLTKGGKDKHVKKKAIFEAKSDKKMSNAWDGNAHYSVYVRLEPNKKWVLVIKAHSKRASKKAANKAKIGGMCEQGLIGYKFTDAQWASMMDSGDDSDD